MHRTSIVIPVWNGSEVIAGCLDSLGRFGQDMPYEIICVDNGSADGSADLIAQGYPHVKLMRQPVNLGFAGGINAGIERATGDIFVLLNQDCVVHEGWLSALVNVVTSQPKCGAVGCTILDADGAVNHAGARLQRPLAIGEHLTVVPDRGPVAVDYVTGAVCAIPRTVWEVVGPFDEDFYPAYYEETDFCYRVRRHGYEVLYTPQATVSHLFSSRAWQVDPVKHAIDQQRSRFRFVVKQFSAREVEEFAAAEAIAIEAEVHFDQLAGRAVAARSTLANLDAILARRVADMNLESSSILRRQFFVHFGEIVRLALARVHALKTPDESANEDVGSPDKVGDAYGDQLRAERVRLEQELSYLRERQMKLLADIYFRSPRPENKAESALERLWRIAVLRPFSILTGREHHLFSELSTLHVSRLDHLESALNNRLYLLEHRINLLETDLRRHLDALELAEMLSHYEQR